MRILHVECKLIDVAGGVIGEQFAAARQIVRDQPRRERIDRIGIAAVLGSYPRRGALAGIR